MVAGVVAFIGRGEGVRMRSLRLGMGLLILSGAVFVDCGAASSASGQESKQSKEEQIANAKDSAAAARIYNYLLKHPDEMARIEANMNAAKKEEEKVVKAQPSLISLPASLPTASSTASSSASSEDVSFKTLRAGIIAFKADSGENVVLRKEDRETLAAKGVTFTATFGSPKVCLQVTDLGLTCNDGTSDLTEPLKSFKFLTQAEQQGHHVGDIEKDASRGKPLTELQEAVRDLIEQYAKNTVKNQIQAELDKAGLTRFSKFWTIHQKSRTLNLGYVEKPAICFVDENHPGNYVKEGDLILVEQPSGAWQYVRIVAPAYYIGEMLVLNENQFVGYGTYKACGKEEAFNTDRATRERLFKQHVKELP
jgi:hypothetical protein